MCGFVQVCLSLLFAHRVRWWSILWCLGLSAFSLQAAVNVLTWRNDPTHQGQNLHESILTLDNVNSTSFGKWFSYRADGFVYAQPLYMTHVTVPGKGVRNLVFIATEHASVYAFDADDPTKDDYGPLWKTSLIDPSHGLTTLPLTDMGFPSAEISELGITSTPVIDPATGTLYAVAQTRQVNADGTVSHPQWLHALDIATGAEKFGGPTRIRASVPGSGTSADGNGQVQFDELYCFQRSGLLLANGTVYAAYASIGDAGPYHGWVLGFDAQTLNLTRVFCDTPNGYQGGIWMTGGSPALDEDGNIYVVTANGDFGPSMSDYGDSVLKLAPAGNNLTVADYFTPYNQVLLDAGDGDLGSGTALLLPDAVGSPEHPHLLVSGSKEGTIYLIDRDNMGHFNPADDSQIVQNLVEVITPALCTPAYFNGYIYVQGISDNLKAFSISNGLLSTNAVMQNSQSVWGFPGGNPNISANGTNNGIVWLIETDTFYSSAPAILHAYNATNLEEELYNSSQAGTRDLPGMAQKFAVPVIADGKVFVQGASSVTIYGNLQAPTILDQPVSVAIAPSNSVTLAAFVSGPPPFTYQWTLAGNPISGATNATLDLKDLPPGANGPYVIRASNSYGATLSEEATVLVTEAPTLTIDSDQQLLLTGSAGVTYRIEVADQLANPQSWSALTEISLAGEINSGEPAQASFRDPSPAPATHFYRARVLPPSSTTNE